MAKLSRAQFAIEPLPILDAIIMDHQVSTACIRKLPFQLRCLDPDCDECVGITMDLQFLWSSNVAPMLARSVLKILPIKSSAKEVETAAFGNIRPTDIDWDRLERGVSKSDCNLI